MSIPRFALLDKKSLRLLKSFFLYSGCGRMAQGTGHKVAVYQWCEFKSRRRRRKKLLAQKSNSTTVGLSFQTKIYLIGIVGFVHYFFNCIGGVMISVLASSAVDRGFQFRLGQTKDYKIDICCFSTKHAALRSKSKAWLAENQDNLSEWGDMPIRRLLFQCARIIKIQLCVLVQNNADPIIISLKINLFSP